MSSDEMMNAEQSVRLLRAKAAEMEKTALHSPNSRLFYIIADLALVAQTLADHIERVELT
jgi:hypothetical protein